MMKDESQSKPNSKEFGNVKRDMHLTEKTPPMNWFEEINIKSFRRLTNVDLPLNPLTVLVGEDGVGKSSFLDVWLLMQAARSGGLSQQIEDWGGLKSLLTRSAQKVNQPDVDELSIGLTMSCSDSEPLYFRMSLKSLEEAYWLSEEKLTQRDGRIFIDFLEPLHIMQSPIISATNPEAKLGHLQTIDQSPIQFRNRLQTLQHYQALNCSQQSSVRQPQNVEKVTSPGLHGESLISFLDTMKNQYPDIFEQIEEGLKSCFPDFERFDFPIVSNGIITIGWKETHYAQSFPLSQIPDGTLRFIWLFAILLQPELPELILLDDVELGLHSKMFRPLAELLRKTSKKTQLIVTTQSDRLARCFQPEDVIIAEREQGETLLTRGDQVDLNRWLLAYSLGFQSTREPLLTKKSY